MKSKEKGKKEDIADEEGYPPRSGRDANDFADNESYMSSLEDGSHLFHRTEGKGIGQGQGQGPGLGGEPLFLSGVYSEALVPMSGVKIGKV